MTARIHRIFCGERFRDRSCARIHVFCLQICGDDEPLALGCATREFQCARAVADIRHVAAKASCCVIRSHCERRIFLECRVHQSQRSGFVVLVVGAQSFLIEPVCNLIVGHCLGNRSARRAKLQILRDCRSHAVDECEPVCCSYPVSALDQSGFQVYPLDFHRECPLRSGQQPTLKDFSCTSATCSLQISAGQGILPGKHELEEPGVGDDG